MSAVHRLTQLELFAVSLFQSDCRRAALLGFRRINVLPLNQVTVLTAGLETNPQAHTLVERSAVQGDEITKLGPSLCVCVCVCVGRRP